MDGRRRSQLEAHLLPFQFLSERTELVSEFSQRDSQDAIIGNGCITTKTAQPELVDIIDVFGELTVVLYEIDVICSSQETGESGMVRVPERRRDDSCSPH